MKTIRSMIAALGLAFALPAPADAATTDPEMIIYRFPGVADFAGVTTSFHCTNFSGVAENIRFVTRDFDSSIRSNVVVTIAHLATKTASTRNTNLYGDDPILSTLTVTQGTTAIAATSINIICTAETIDANAFVPVGVARRGIRFNPVPGSQE
jgi:hypothetical protein